MHRIDTLKTETFRHLTDQARRIATVTHTHPDGDAAGSSIGMAEWLRSIGKEVFCFFPDPVPGTLRFMLAGEVGKGCVVFSEQPAEAARILGTCDLVICLDFPALHRAEGMEEVLSALTVPKVLIDHHVQPQADAFAVCFSETEISSASELVFQVLTAVGAELPQTAANALMTGMLTDTNNFSNSTYPSTLDMAARLMERGVNRDLILQSINQNYEERRLRAMGFLLERMTVTPDGMAFMILDAAARDRFGLEDGETEGFVNLPLSIRNVRMSIFLKEAEGHFRVSVRSKRGTSARRVAERYFHGGGHELAAGGKLFFPGDIPVPAEAAAYLETITDEKID